jgi:DNA-damage-inducible protein J
MGRCSLQATKLFAKAVINYGGMPFELCAKTLNVKTLEALQELESRN